MSIDRNDIITLPNGSLRKRSKKVGLVDESIKKLIADMESATLDWEDHRKHEVGVALAAVQIDCLSRVVIVRNSFEDKSDRSFQIFINPVITKKEGAIIEDYEGCLSIKDVYGKVPRYEKIRVKAMSPDGKEIRFKANGFLARVFQHEIDHTNGIPFVDHIKNKPDAFYRLTDTGELEKLDYHAVIKDNHELWG